MKDWMKALLTVITILTVMMIPVVYFGSQSIEVEICGWNTPSGNCKCAWHYGEDYIYTHTGGGLFGGG